MASIHSVLHVQVLVDSAGGGTKATVVFSPGKPKTVVVLFEDAPPEVHDFGKTELQGDKESGYVVVLDADTRSTNAQGMPISFRDVAGAAAYRPGSDELAMIFRVEGEETHDHTVWRFNPSTLESLPSIYFENPSCVAYSNDGEHLAIGGSDGTVTVFRLDESGEAVELRTVNVTGGVICMVFEDIDHQLYVATENHRLVSFLYAGDEDFPLQRGVELEDGATINNMCLKALAYSAEHNLIAAAGIGNEVWVSSPTRGRGRVLRFRNATRINSLQFDGRSDAVIAFGDVGVELVAFSLDAENLPVFEERTVRFSPRMKMIGCHHYGDFLFVASLIE